MSSKASVALDAIKKRWKLYGIQELDDTPNLRNNRVAIERIREEWEGVLGKYDDKTIRRALVSYETFSVHRKEPPTLEHLEAELVKNFRPAPEPEMSPEMLAKQREFAGVQKKRLTGLKRWLNRIWRQEALREFWIDYGNGKVLWDDKWKNFGNTIDRIDTFVLRHYETGFRGDVLAGRIPHTEPLQRQLQDEYTLLKIAIAERI